MPRGRRQAIAVLLLAAVVVAVTPARASEKKTVKIVGSDDATYAFDPVKLKVDKGTTVHWSWDSNAPHDVTFASLGEQSETADSATYKLKFRKAGRFKYICTVHGFKGKVVVR